jgi:hypothetical protein
MDSMNGGCRITDIAVRPIPGQLNFGELPPATGRGGRSFACLQRWSLNTEVGWPGERKPESRAFSRSFGLRPNAPSIPFDDLLAQG